MTPAINLAKKNKISHRIHEYSHDASCDSYGAEAAKKLCVTEARVFKTLVISLDKSLLVTAVIPVSSKLSMKLIAKATGAKKAVMADQITAERATGYVLGGISPLGQKMRLKTIIDSSAKIYDTIYVSAGRRGLELELNPEELRCLVDGKFAQISQQIHT